MTDSTPQNTSSIKQRALLNLQSGRFSDARELLNKALQMTPDDADIWTLLAQLNYHLKDMSALETCLRKVCSLQPNNPMSSYNPGILLQQQGRHTEALECFQSIYVADTRNALALSGMAACQWSIGNFSDAERLCRLALDLEPTIAEAWNCLGLALRSLHRTEESVDNFGRAIQLRPDCADFHFNLGLSLDDSGRTADAKQAFNETLKLNQGHALAHSRLSMIHLLVGKLDNALQHAQAAATLQSDDPTIHIQLGDIYAAREDFHNALQCYNRALALDDKRAAAYLALALLHSKTRKYTESIEYFKRSLTLHDDPSLVYCHMGMSYFVQDMFDEAAATFRKAIDNNPSWARPVLELGRLHFEREELDEATLCFEKVLVLEPQNKAAKVFLNALHSEHSSDSARNEYAAELFDDYADNFDEHLTSKLCYRTPELLSGILFDLLGNDGSPGDVLDAGCGTGLMGMLLKDRAKSLTGVDVSEKMLEKARERNVYTKIYARDLNAHLQSNPENYDLIVAADVFVYIGCLEKVFENTFAALRSNGLFAFSVELLDGKSYRLQRSVRYAHSEHYIREKFAASGFEILTTQNCELRKEFSGIIPGMLFVARKPARVSD